MRVARSMMAGALLAGGVLGGCSLAPHYVRAVPPVTESWPTGDAYLAQREAALPVVSYREIFTDPRFQTLVETALANNRDIRVAAANLAAARAQVRVVRANQFPEIDASAGVRRVDGDGGGSGSASGGSGGGTGTGGTGSSGSSSGSGGSGTSYTASVGVSSFELDLFGRLANATEAQRQSALATEAVARTVRLGLVADLANAWAQHAADSDLLRIARATAASAGKSVALSRARLAGGVSPRTELRQAEQILATADADVAAQTTAVAQDRNLIVLLAGGPVDPALLPASLAEVVGTVRTLPAGTSSEVLLRRPDVLAAEFRLRSANAEIGVARAALFPRISLTGLLGLASDALTSLFSGGAFHTTLGASASYSIFNAGGARAGVAVSEAERDAALATYEKAIQTAFREVSDALARQGTIGAELAAVRRQEAATADTAALTTARYRGGVASSLENLDAQRSLYTAQRTLVREQLLLVQNRVTLYRVLGGDQLAPPVPR